VNSPFNSSSLTIPAFKEMALAVSILSPVHMMVVIPAFLHFSIDSTIVSLSGSYKPQIPIASRPPSSRHSLSASFSKSLWDAFNSSYSSIDISFLQIKIVL